MAQVHHFGGGEVLGVRLAHHVTLVADLERHGVVRPLLDRAQLREQPDDVRPCEIMRERMPVKRVERRQPGFRQLRAVAFRRLKCDVDVVCVRHATPFESQMPPLRQSAAPLSEEECRRGQG